MFKRHPPPAAAAAAAGAAREGIAQVTTGAAVGWGCNHQGEKRKKTRPEILI